MSFTNQTTNYGLPQWIGTDKPTYLVDQNGAYQTIDTQLYNANSNAATAVSSASSAVEVAGTAATNAQTAIDSAATANTNANNAVATANTAITNAASAVATANSALDIAEDLGHLVDTHEYTSETYINIFNNVGTAINAAKATYPLNTHRYMAVCETDDGDVYTYEFNTYNNTNNYVAAVTTRGTTNIRNVIAYLTGTGSGVRETGFAASGSTSTDIGSNTISGTVKVYANKII